MICYPDQLELLLTFALDSNAIGPDYFYLFPGQDVYSLERTLRIKDGTFVPCIFLLFLEYSLPHIFTYIGMMLSRLSFQ